jgi:hypothetical protein
MKMEYLLHTKFANTPPEVPTTQGKQVKAPVPVVYYGRGSGAVEYKVISCPSGETAQMEAELNKFGKDGWRLVGILPPGSQVMLLFMRST